LVAWIFYFQTGLPPFSTWTNTLIIIQGYLFISRVQFGSNLFIGSDLRVQLIKMWDSHVRRLSWHFIFIFLFSFLSSFFFGFLLHTTRTMDEHRHNILMILILTMAMHQVIVVFSPYFVFKKIIIPFKFQIWRKRNFQIWKKKKILSKQALWLGFQVNLPCFFIFLTKFKLHFSS
jgi:hypothetical protein